jgi:hypothetical protein
MHLRSQPKNLAAARLNCIRRPTKHERHGERAFVKMRLAFTAIALLTAWGHVRGDPTDERQPPPLVTCGSPIRLTHASTGHQLLSDTIAWDSLRQSITAEVSQTMSELGGRKSQVQSAKPGI